MTKFSQELNATFSTVDAEPFINEHAIGFLTRKPLTDSELTHLWNLLAQDLPSLKNPQTPIADLSTAKRFRKKQGL